MLKKVALVFGVVLLVVGVLGFVPAVTREGHLLGIFHVNAAHNVVHLLTGAISLACGLSSAHAARAFFRTFGIVYGLVAILGFMSGNQPILGIANNVADAWLHTGIAFVSLFLGFGFKESRESFHEGRIGV